MTNELNLRFPDKDHCEVAFEGVESGKLDFQSPLTPKDRKDLRWYLEIYGAHSLGNPDDKDGRRIAASLPEWGKALFDAVFTERPAQRLFNRFQDATESPRLLTIRTEDPSILALPWELLHDSASGGVFLFNERPRISIRRRLLGATGGRAPLKVKAKERLHILFVVSRPEGTGFIDPRADAAAVLDALEDHGPGRFTWEFLRPPTLDALNRRLDDRDRPVDILHFDGHGVFDARGGLLERAGNRGVGYLLFEKAECQPDPVPAEKLGFNLHRCHVPLVILSACQSASLGEGEEAMGSVAVQLTAAGIPAVLAMTHSVLVPTTKALFGELYMQIARRKTIGEALDAARLHLFNNPEKYQVQRGPDRVPLLLSDWFVPALYQTGAEMPLIDEGEGAMAPKAPRTNVPARPEAGFFGRRRELWDMERWFHGKTRRITLTGFGGQGKTALAEEAARWLCRTGMFEAAVLVDYSRCQALDAVEVAVRNIGSVLDQTLLDASAAREALAKTAMLVILDNLEALAPEPLWELLDAAKGWSEAGPSRVLLTTRTPDFGHPDYAIQNTFIHRRIVMEGLGSRAMPDDALGWFAELSKLPPSPVVAVPQRGDLIDLFDRVRFHPLSIIVLAQQLKSRPPKELGERLEELLASPGASSSVEGSPPELVASLRLSLDRLDDASRLVLPRLGVFQGGAFEDYLLEITGLGEGNVWPGLRRQLEAAALVQAEALPGVIPPFLRFHPTLAPMLWGELGLDERDRLAEAHRQRYHGVANYLYYEDSRTPHQARAIAGRELPNLLCAVQAAFDASDPDAVEFATGVIKFLSNFGLGREAGRLSALAQAASGDEGSEAWYLAQSTRGEQLLALGRTAEAVEVFKALLAKLDDTDSYNRVLALGRIGRCSTAGGQPNLAVSYLREGIAVARGLEQDDRVRQLMSTLHGELGNALLSSGHYQEARREYELGLKIDEEIENLRGQSVAMGQLGMLAWRERKLKEALMRYQAARVLFKQLSEPASEAVALHQIGVILHESQHLDEAEQHYRESARICEDLGDISGATAAWNQLAIVSKEAGKTEAAEGWYRKAIGGFRDVGDQLGFSKSLGNLSNLLRSQPSRLEEARLYGEEALAIKQTLDPEASELWVTYHVLAEIEDAEAALTTDRTRQEELQAKAIEHRRLALEKRRAFAGTPHEMKRYAPFIQAIFSACMGNAEARQEVETYLALLRQAGPGWCRTADNIKRLLVGERDVKALCSNLPPDGTIIVDAALATLSNPNSMTDILSKGTSTRAPATPPDGPTPEHTEMRSYHMDTCEVEDPAPAIHLNAWFPDHRGPDIRLRVGEAATLMIDMGPRHTESPALSEGLPQDLLDRMNLIDHLDVVVLCPGAQVLPLSQRLDLPPPTKIATFTVTPEVAGELDLKVILLYSNEPLHRAHIALKALAPEPLEGVDTQDGSVGPSILPSPS